AVAAQIGAHHGEASHQLRRDEVPADVRLRIAMEEQDRRTRAADREMDRGFTRFDPPRGEAFEHAGVYSAAFRSFCGGCQRRTGLRAASVSSNRRLGARCGQPWKYSASPALARFARARSTAMKASSDSRLSLSVGSMSKAPWTTSGKYIVMGW